MGVWGKFESCNKVTMRRERTVEKDMPVSLSSQLNLKVLKAVFLLPYKCLL